MVEVVKGKRDFYTQEDVDKAFIDVSGFYEVRGAIHSVGQKMRWGGLLKIRRGDLTSFECECMDWALEGVKSKK